MGNKSLLCSLLILGFFISTAPSFASNFSKKYAAQKPSIQAPKMGAIEVKQSKLDKYVNIAADKAVTTAVSTVIGTPATLMIKAVEKYNSLVDKKQEDAAAKISGIVRN